MKKFTKSPRIHPRGKRPQKMFIALHTISHPTPPSQKQHSPSKLSIHKKEPAVRKKKKKKKKKNHRFYNYLYRTQQRGKEKRHEKPKTPQTTAIHFLTDLFLLQLQANTPII
jgi:hypothetical protein